MSRFAETRIALTLLAILGVMAATIVVSGCGEDEKTQSTQTPADAAARKDLLIAYRTADRERLSGLRCQTDMLRRCTQRHWYPRPRTLQLAVGSVLLKRLVVDLARSTDDVIDPEVTYIVSSGTQRKSILLAQRTPEGTTWVLHGSPSGYRFTHH